MSEIKGVDNSTSLSTTSTKVDHWGWLKNLSHKVFRSGSSKISVSTQKTSSADSSGSKPTDVRLSPQDPLVTTEEVIPPSRDKELKEPMETTEQLPHPMPESDAKQDPEDLLQVNTEKLSLPETTERVFRPANKIFLHTTPTRNVTDIRQTGLIATQNKDVIGRDLGYSLTFSSEYNVTSVGRVALEKKPVEDFSLTVWKNSKDIQRIKDVKGKTKAGMYGLARRIEADDVITETYLDSRGGGKWNKAVNPEMMRKIDPVNFLAAVPIDENTQNVLTRCKIEFAYDLADADTIEGRLVEFLDDPERHLQLSPGYTPQVLAHDLMARIQQEVLVYQTRVVAEDLLNRVQSLKLPLSDNRDIVDAEIGEISAKTTKVNEPVSNRCLRMWKKKLKQTCEKKGIAWSARTGVGETERKAILESLSIIDHYKLWGGRDGFNLAIREADSMGITL